MTASVTIPAVLPEPAQAPEQGSEPAARRFQYDWRQVERGLPLSELDAFSAYSGIPVKAMLEVVIPARTLKHRKQRNEPFSIEESDRLARIARIFALAEQVYGDHEDGREWLLTSKELFENKTALELLKTQAGGRAVEEYLYQLDEGMFV